MTFRKIAIGCVLVALALIGAVVVIQSSRQARTNGSRTPEKICFTNRKQLASAISEWAQVNRKDGKAVPLPSEIFGSEKFVKTAPLCQAGGRYWWGGTKDPVVCSVHGAAEFNLRGTIPPHPKK